MKQLDLWYFEAIEMTSQAWSKFREYSPAARILHTKFMIVK